MYVQMHNFPDPDAIASAYGMKYLLRAEGIDAQIVYMGSIENTVTAKMVKLLNTRYYFFKLCHLNPHFLN